MPTVKSVKPVMIVAGGENGRRWREEMFLEMGWLGPDATPERLKEVNARFQTDGLPGDQGLPWRQMRPTE